MNGVKDMNDNSIVFPQAYVLGSYRVTRAGCAQGLFGREDSVRYAMFKLATSCKSNTRRPAEDCKLSCRPK